MQTIAQQLQQIKNTLPNNVRLIAVSKTHPLTSIEKAYAAGQRLFGESRPQELAQKAALLPPDIEWHFIGHLQTNKVKQVLGVASLIHTIDSARLLLEIEKEAAKRDITVQALFQLHIAREETKSGFTPHGLHTLLQQHILRQTPHVQIAGLMGMATFTDDLAQIRNEFRGLKHLFDEIKYTHFPSDNAFCKLSMGMSNDYPIAVEEGSTLVRVGTAIFGQHAP